MSTLSPLTTIAHMKPYLDPVKLAWVESLGIDENMPISWGVESEVLRDPVQEAENPGFKCFKPGPHMTLTVSDGTTTHTQIFVNINGTWRINPLQGES